MMKRTRRDILRLCLGASAASLSFTATAHGSDGCPVTAADDKGPFYLPGAPHRSILAALDEPGERLIVRGRVLGGDCRTPVANAILDIWQADASGKYHSEKENYRLRGQIKTSRVGAYELNTVKPGSYKLENEGFRPAHIHFIVTHPGYEPLTTQLYFAGDPYLAPDDACGDDCHSDDPDRIVDLTRVEKIEQNWVEARFDVVLKPLKK